MKSVWLFDLAMFFRAKNLLNQKISGRKIGDLSQHCVKARDFRVRITIRDLSRPIRPFSFILASDQLPAKTRKLTDYRQRWFFAEKNSWEVFKANLTTANSLFYFKTMDQNFPQIPDKSLLFSKIQGSG